MRPSQIEAWALSVVDRIARQEPIEDTRVELKKEWPDPTGAARRIAGHLNAARGDHVLWIIGVDEKAGTVVGAANRDFATWWPQVKSHFEGVPPEMVDLVVPYGESGNVVALLFEADRLPFVVKNPAYGSAGVSVSLEVPWREGTAVRSARRGDLLRVLTAVVAVPRIEVLSAEFHLTIGKVSSPDAHRFEWYVSADLFVEPANGGFVLLTSQRCEGMVSFDSGLSVLLADFRFAADRSDHASSTGAGVIVTAPSVVEIRASSMEWRNVEPPPAGPARLRFELRGAESDLAAIASVDVLRSIRLNLQTLSTWIFGRRPYMNGDPFEIWLAETLEFLQHRPARLVTAATRPFAVRAVAVGRLRWSEDRSCVIPPLTVKPSPS